MNLVKCGVTRDGLREQVTPPSIQRPCSASCKALKKAISSLHRVDDFDHEYIGSGFFSDIYKVVHKVTRQVMVLKKNVKTINRSNVRREIQLMNKLSHPNILRFYGVCVIEGHMHALVEYINGGSLEQLLADKSVELPWMQRIHLACDIAKGIKYLHSKGYMHRDLTSKNILIKKYTDGRTAAVVADLGLADRIPDPEKQVASVGSPYWMAPECISGRKYTEKADVFSYGIVLCEIIARVEADPDILPRTKKFGVDYVEFSKMSADCPLHLLHQAFICCQIEPSKRPCFQRIVLNLQEMKSSAQMAVILADLSRLGIVNSGKNVLNRMLLEKILDEKLKQRKRTADDVQHSLNQTPPPYAPSTGNLHQVHSPSNNEASDQTIRSTINFVPVTPMIVGKVMSRDDVYYAPQQGNPFPVRLRSAKWVEKSKESWKSSLCTSDDGNETDRGILEDCTDFLELHSPQERHARSCQQSMSHSRHLPLTCFPSMVLPEFISTPSSTSSTFSRINRRLQRSNSMPGSPSSLFENDEQKDSFATSSQVTSNSFSSDKLKNNFGDFSSANTSFSLCSTETLSCFQSNTIAPHTVEQTSDASEYGSSSMDSALGSEVARVRPRRSCVIPSGARKESVTPKAIQRHNRVCSATVYRSSSTVYPQFEEAAILAKYFEICRSDSFNSSQNSSSPFCSTGYDHSDDNECLATNSIYRRSPSPTMHSSKESNLVTSSSGIDSDAPWEDQDQSLSEEPNLGKRDDPNRKSRERFLQLVKNWENNSSNNSVDKISSQPVENVSKDSVALRPGGQARLMEFAEFYLLRRFQELKQKWERRQQGQTSSKVAKSSKIRDGDETIRNSPEKFEEVLLTT